MIIKTIPDVPVRSLEFEETRGGTLVAKFAVVKDVQDNSGNEFPVWQDCKAYGYLAEMLQNNNGEGRRVSISGEMEYWQYEGDTYNALNVSSLRFVDAAGQSSGSTGTPSKQRSPQSGPTDQSQGSQEEDFIPDDDLPF